MRPDRYPASTFCSATHRPARLGRPFTRLRTNGHTGYVALVAFARTGEADTLGHAWLAAASTRQWGSRVAQAVQALVVL
eukprot:15482284-Alexandrium_andersonii.AAC.1